MGRRIPWWGGRKEGTSGHNAPGRPSTSLSLWERRDRLSTLQNLTQDGGTLGFSSTTTEGKWIAGRWSPRGSEVKRIGREEGNPWGRSLTLAPLPQEENESESMIEDKISDFLHCEVRATGKIYPVWYTPVVFSWMLQGVQIFCQESESEAKVKQISQLVAGV